MEESDKSKKHGAGKMIPRALVVDLIVVFFFWWEAADIPLDPVKYDLISDRKKRGTGDG